MIKDVVCFALYYCGGLIIPMSRYIYSSKHVKINFHLLIRKI